MQKQTVRQQARARARQAMAKVRQEQAARERRLAMCGEQVAVALAERDAVVSDCEQRAGRALRSLIKDDGLKTHEVLSWCGVDTLTGREIYRLIRRVNAVEHGSNSQPVGDDADQFGEDAQPGEQESVRPAITDTR